METNCSSSTDMLQHEVPCTDAEVLEMNCQNSGTCLALVSDMGRQLGCKCSGMWAGARCEEFYFDPQIFASREQMFMANVTSIIIACLLALLFIAIIVILGLVIYIKRHCQRAERVSRTFSEDLHRSIRRSLGEDPNSPSTHLHSPTTVDGKYPVFSENGPQKETTIPLMEKSKPSYV